MWCPTAPSDDRVRPPRGGRRKGLPKVNVAEEVEIAINIAVQRFRNSDDKELDFPSSFTKTERAFVHRLCQSLGLVSKSRNMGSMRYLTVRKKGGVVATSPEMKFVMSPAVLHAAHVLLRRFPVTSKERTELLPSTDRASSSYESGLKQDTARISGRLNKGVPQVCPPRGTSDLEAFRKRLPVAEFEGQLLETIATSSVVLVVGETGSGKTTQIPQFILDESTRLGQPCRILCTQPRRIAAVAMATRVAAERGEDVGQTIGYQIRLESRVSPKTLLTFCTNGVLLRTLMSGDSTMSTITHIIVDEVHERDRFCDFLLIKLRDILQQQCHLRVVLMSAALDVSLFSTYFSGCPIIRLPGRLFDVKQLFLEDILRTTGYKSKAMEMYQREKDKLQSQQSNLSEWYAAREPGPGAPACGSGAACFLDHSTLLKDEEESPFVQEAEHDGSNLEPWLVREMDECINKMWLYRDEDAFTQLLHLMLSEHVSVDYRHSGTSATPLMASAGRGFIRIVEHLLALGANVNLKAHDGTTALDWARTFNQVEVLELMESFAASGGEAMPDEIVMGNGGVAELSPEDRDLLTVYHNTFDDDKVDLDLILHLLNQICHGSDEGAVLIFLPGYDDIVSLRDLILFDDKRFVEESHKFHVFTLHSNMQMSDQRRVLKSVPSGVRKIILSTNIAESSITVNDVVFVINSGKVKEKSYDAITSVTMLKTVWISKASCLQRRGRAGRCRPGICFHLFSKVRFQNMLEFQTPELLREPLQELCLHTKLLAPTCMSIAEFLALAPDPPPTLIVRNALRILKAIDAMDDAENLTDLGHHLSDLPVEPHLGKMVLCSVVLKCLDPVLTIVCSLAYRDPFTLPSQPAQKRAAVFSRRKFSASTFSDHMAFLRAFQAWQKASADGWERAFCERNFLSQATMEMIFGMRSQLLGQLRASGFVRARGGGDIRDVNSNSENWAVVKAALVAGLYPNLIHVARATQTLSTQLERKVRLHPSSVLDQSGFAKSSQAEQGAPEGVAPLPTEWLVFGEMTRAHRLPSARCISAVSSVAVVLFAGPSHLPASALQRPLSENVGAIDCDNSDSEEEDNSSSAAMAVLQIDEWIKFKLDSEAASLLLQLRQKWHTLFTRRMRAPTRAWSQADDATLTAVVAALTHDDLALGLQQPSGIGQRPRPVASEEPYFAPLLTEAVAPAPAWGAAKAAVAPAASWRAAVNQKGGGGRRGGGGGGGAGSGGGAAGGAETTGESPLTEKPKVVLPPPGFQSLKQRGPAARKGNGATGITASPPSSAKGPKPASPRRPQTGVRYFIMKSSNMRNLELSQEKGIWSTTLATESKLNSAFVSCPTVYLIFSVQGSGHFQGFGRMASEIGKERCKEWGSSSLGGVFQVQWLCSGNLSFQQAQHLLNPWNDNKKVQISRDGQELETQVGEQLVKLWESWTYFGAGESAGAGNGGGAGGARGAAGAVYDAPAAGDRAAALAGGRDGRSLADGNPLYARTARKSEQ